MAAKKTAQKGKATAAKKRPESTADQSAPTTTVEISADGQTAETIRELVGIAERVDAAGLELLLNAARAVETKGKIETFNRELNVVAGKAAKKRRELMAPEYHVHIERTEDDFFIIQLDDARVFFNRQEMREITKICHAVKDSAAGSRRLFKWFEKERSDLLVDAGINSERSPYLADLYELVIATYKVKK